MLHALAPLVLGLRGRAGGAVSPNEPIDKTHRQSLRARAWINERFDQLKAEWAGWDLTPMPKDWVPDDD